MFNWEDFINLSKELLNYTNTQYKEALYRTIVSRSYYGVFKQVEDKLKEVYILPERDSKGRKLGSHERIVYYLQNHKDYKVKNFGNRLDRLKRQRHKVDYDTQASISRENSEKALKLAEKLSYEWSKKIKFLLGVR